MRLVRNTGKDRVVDRLLPALEAGHSLHVITDQLSVHAYQELRAGLRGLDRVRLVLPAEGSDLGLFGTEADRGQRNLLRQRWLAGAMARWLSDKVEIRRATSPIPQGMVVVSGREGEALQAFLGSLAFSTAGLGLTAGNPLAVIQASETA